MRRRAASDVAELTEEGRLTLTALEGFRRGRAVGEIADDLFAAFAGRFESRDACLGFVGELAVKYGA
jgi:hypothetical protein